MRRIPVKVVNPITLAYEKYYRAVLRGELKRKPCEVCGITKTHGHHENYRKPLEVMWLCALHHRQRHSVIGYFRWSGKKIVRYRRKVRTNYRQKLNRKVKSLVKKMECREITYRRYIKELRIVYGEYEVAKKNAVIHRLDRGVKHVFNWRVEAAHQAGHIRVTP